MTSMLALRNLYQKYATELESSGYSSLADINQQTFNKFSQTVRGQLSTQEATELHSHAKKYVALIQAEQRKIVTRSNPQLKNIKYLKSTQSNTTSHGFEDLFEQRTNTYVDKDSVASMFSPAAYLSVLYQQARLLHIISAPQNLDIRRPDLSALTLNQSNQDTEINTLTLSNEILRNRLTGDDLDQNMASQLYPFDLPYHAPFSNIEMALDLHKSSFKKLADNLSIGNLDETTYSAFSNNLPPALVSDLLTPIPIDKDDLNTRFTKHFGKDATVISLSSIETFCEKTGISCDELNSYLGLPVFQRSFNNLSNHAVTNRPTPPAKFGGSYLAVANSSGTIADGGKGQVMLNLNGQLKTSTFTYEKNQEKFCLDFLILPDPSEGQVKLAIVTTEHKNLGPSVLVFDNKVYGIKDAKDKAYEQLSVPYSKDNHTFNIYHDDGWRLEFRLVFSEPKNITTEFLIKLSQIIRYCKKTGLTPATLDTLIMLSQDAATQPAATTISINALTLQLTARVLDYMARYTISEDDAVVLIGGDINVYEKTGEINQFDQLFNHPALNDQYFTTDDTDDALNFDPEDTVYWHQRAVLMRTLSVDNAGLTILCKICTPNDNNWARSLKNISMLYRVGLWAKLHNITPESLQILLQLNGKVAEDLRNATLQNLFENLSYIYITCQWLEKQQLPVIILNVMTTTNYPQILTPEMENLLHNLYQSAKDEPADLSVDELSELRKKNFAPYLASTLNLSGIEQAKVVQDWMDLIAEERGLALKSMGLFWLEIIKLYDEKANDTADIAGLAAFCQALGQLSLIVNNWQLSNVELALLVNQPTILPANSNQLSLTLNNLQGISRFKLLQDNCGKNVSELLTILDKNQLDTALLANLLNKTDNEVTQAIAGTGIKSTYFNVTQAIDISAWLQNSEKLGISTQNLGGILNLSLGDDYNHWANQATNILSGLPANQQTQINRKQEEILSTALCACYLGIAPLASGIPLNNRNDIFQYLLIDNLISGNIKTTRIAEAIASIQLYINRCLQGMEDAVEPEQLLGKFFEEWDQYNKRYSTWAGVSQLAYYPENYLNPTLRYNQTGIQKQLLSEISQSQLSKDSIETAYLNYLSGFEDIANLKILSGYHHGETLNKGTSYFVGRSNTTPYRYFWRSLNVEASDGIGGYVASAWSDWEEINTPINSDSDQVRAIIFNNRLYICWIEKRTEAVAVANIDPEIDNTITNNDCYNLLLSYRKINNTWSPTIVHHLAVSETLSTFDFYCSFYPYSNAILIYLYDRKAESSETIMAEINSTMQYSKIGDASKKDILNYVSNNLNNEEGQNKCVRQINLNLYTETVESNITETNLDLLTINNAGTNCGLINDSTPPTFTPHAGLVITSNISALNYDVYDISSCLKMTKTQTYDDIFSSISITPQILYTLDGLELGEIKVIRPSGDSPATVNAGVIRQYTVSFSVLTANIPDKIKVSSGAFVWALDVSQNKRCESDDIGKWVGCEVYTDEQFKTYINQLTKLDGLYESIVGKPLLSKQQIGDKTIITTMVSCWDDGIIPNTPNACFIYTDCPGINFLPDTVYEASPYNLPTLTDMINDYTNLTDITYEFGALNGKLRGDKNEISADLCEPIQLPDNDNQRSFELNINHLGKTYKETYTFIVTEDQASPKNPLEYAQIIQSDNLAIYLDLQHANQPKRTRLNTLFSNELISRSSGGVKNVLNWETQQLPEPQLGEGIFVELVLNKYNLVNHGDMMDFTIENVNIWETNDNFPIYAGTLSKSEFTTIKIFLGRFESGVDNNYLYIRANYASGPTSNIRFRKDSETSDTWILDDDDTYKLFTGLRSANVLIEKTEPMDFSGANGLYFWELFYYTPMLVVERTLNAQNFEEAEKWLKYVFNPQSYRTRNYLTASPNRYWNVRPLEEDSAWDNTQIDSTDPDIVAQGDPMHYKVATYIKLQDLLLARGDMAYRQLERDTLAEAKMWYVAALNLLGQEPDLPKTGNWSEPSLAMVASQIEAPEVRTANALIGLFQPSENEKLKGYWKTLNQRLYNLRHNLSIDGQPLTLPLYASPADPEALQSAAAAISGNNNPQQHNVNIAIQRFPIMLENARSLVAQLTQFGSTLTSLLERKDSEALSILLQTQANDLMERSLQLQNKSIEQLQAEQEILMASLKGAKVRHDAYQKLLKEGISSTEQQCIDQRLSSSSLALAANAVRTAGGVLDLAPNTFGLAVGGSRWGAATSAAATGMDIIAGGLTTSAEALSTSEQYRRREQEWTLQFDTIKHEIQQIEAQQTSQNIQLEAAQQQLNYLETQQAQTKIQLDFLKTKFSCQALYSWMQGHLSAIFYQFYDITITRCLKAQLGYQWETNDTATFIQTGAWDSNHAGLLCGETLMLNLAQMEAAYLEWDERTLEVQRTVSMAQSMKLDSTGFTNKIKAVLGDTIPSNLDDDVCKHTIELSDDNQLIATINLSSLALDQDYPENLGSTRRIKQVSVSLPALLGPYQDIQAVLAYSGTGGGIHQSCRHAAISHGFNDSGLFQLDFNDSKYLPFEGLPIVGDDGDSSLSLSFPNAKGKQQVLLESLSDIILHIRYTIRN